MHVEEARDRVAGGVAEGMLETNDLQRVDRCTSQGEGPAKAAVMKGEKMPISLYRQGHR